MAGSKCYLFLQLFFFFLFILIFVCLFILCVVRWFKHSGEKSDLQIIRVNLFQELVKVRPIRTMSGRLLDVASFFVFFGIHGGTRFDSTEDTRERELFQKRKKKLKFNRQFNSLFEPTLRRIHRQSPHSSLQPFIFSAS